MFLTRFLQWLSNSSGERLPTQISAASKHVHVFHIGQTCMSSILDNHDVRICGKMCNYDINLYNLKLNTDVVKMTSVVSKTIRSYTTQIGSKVILSRFKMLLVTDDKNHNLPSNQVHLRSSTRKHGTLKKIAQHDTPFHHPRVWRAVRLGLLVLITFGCFIMHSFPLLSQLN